MTPFQEPAPPIAVKDPGEDPLPWRDDSEYDNLAYADAWKKWLFATGYRADGTGWRGIYRNMNKWSPYPICGYKTVNWVDIGPAGTIGPGQSSGRWSVEWKTLYLHTAATGNYSVTAECIGDSQTFLYVDGRKILDGSSSFGWAGDTGTVQFVQGQEYQVMLRNLHNASGGGSGGQNLEIKQAGVTQDGATGPFGIFRAMNIPVYDDIVDNKDDWLDDHNVWTEKKQQYDTYLTNYAQYRLQLQQWLDDMNSYASDVAHYNEQMNEWAVLHANWEQANAVYQQWLAIKRQIEDANASVAFYRDARSAWCTLVRAETNPIGVLWNGPSGPFQDWSGNPANFPSGPVWEAYAWFIDPSHAIPEAVLR
jgi:hypothetical protein